MQRCSWALGDDALMRAYHDEEYGRKKSSDTALFEKLCLECFQAGLSWRTVLHKREAFRKAFFDFDPKKVALMDKSHIDVLMQNSAIIRNRRKIEAVIGNARLHTAQFAEQGSFARYVYGFSDGDKLCRDLKKRGYSFMGETICTSFLMSVGAMIAHEEGCFLHNRD